MKKNKKIKIYLQFPWKFAECSYYKYLVEYAPKNIEYIGPRERRGLIENKKKMIFYRSLKHFAKKIMNLSKIILPNTKLTKTNEEYDLIHCAHCLSKNADKPWIADIEYFGQFTLPMSNVRGKLKKQIEKILKRKNCKKIIPWTKWTQEGILKLYPELKHKMHVIYPGIPAPKFKKKSHKGIRLLFVSRFFYNKGGYHALEAIDRLTKKYSNVSATIISQVPSKIKEHYQNDKISIYDLVPQKKLFEEIYPSTDILIYPSYIDSFGYPLTEAMSFGIPIITVEGNSRREIVEDGKNGYVIKAPEDYSFDKIGPKEEKMIKEMVAKASILIEDEKKRKTFGKRGRKEITHGKFSIKRSNKEFKKIYTEALK